MNTVLETDDLFFVDALISGTNPSKIRVIVDSDKGLNIAKCAGISRQLASMLDTEQLLQDPYNLEVTSPGLDQPLKLRRQYVKNVGRRIKVSLNEGDHKLGKLLEVGENSIFISEDVNSPKGKRPKIHQKMEQRKIEIPFDQILQTTVLVSFKK